MGFVTGGAVGLELVAPSHVSPKRSQPVRWMLSGMAHVAVAGALCCFAGNVRQETFLCRGLETTAIPRGPGTAGERNHRAPARPGLLRGLAERCQWPANGRGAFGGPPTRATQGMDTAVGFPCAI